LLQWLDEVSARQGGLRVLEIGGGYGALAYWFKSAFRNCSYTIIDLPECLLSSALCLGLSLPDQRVTVGRLDALPLGLRFVPNYMAYAVDEQFDLVINTLSLSEMGVPQIRAYAELTARHWIANGGLFFEQNQDNRKIGLMEDLPKVLADYFPYQLIEQQPRDIIKGTPHIWARRQIRLYPHERTEPLT
jgi:SAM-dependent methyltransferase